MIPLSVKPVDESIPSIVLFEFYALVFTPSPALGNRLPDVAVSALLAFIEVVSINIVIKPVNCFVSEIYKYSY